jgi:meso-butanediol dehydrogenase/(S,S)-butanediol dehydrogenase/diacetyl reductase
VAQRLDVADPAACRDAVAAAVAHFGQLDVLCNVAGILQWGHVTDVSEADWTRIVAINLSSVFFLSQAAIPHLLSTQGVIVNMASAAAVRGQAYTSPYCATKAAVVALTKSMAVEYAKRGLRVVAVAPAA